MADRGTGLTFWMDRVKAEHARASAAFDADAVHNLRVALRRCRSIADGYMSFDPDGAWRDMKKSSRTLFREFADLRDIHVMRDWVRRLSAPDDGAALRLTQHLAGWEEASRKKAEASLSKFDTAQWTAWQDHLSLRACVPPGSPVFQHLALERWHDAYQLHRAALRNRTDAAFHNLRIGLKRFRYTVENFLPDRLEDWGADLCEAQDLLGENHDLFVLWRTALHIGALRAPGQRARWRDMISAERVQRLQSYRGKMCGPNSLFRMWRAGLPSAESAPDLATARLGLWAEYRDPDCTHSRHVADLAGQILEGLQDHAPAAGAMDSMRRSLTAAALLHDVGRARADKGHHRISARMIRKITPPLGFDAKQMSRIALIARYHRGAFPHPGHAPLRSLPETERRQVLFLAGILRLANALDGAHNGRIRRVELQKRGDSIWVHACGLLEQDPLAQTIASARHLLEMSCNLPVWVLPI